MNHLVSDSLSRIKNAAMARRREVALPYSNINREIAKALKAEGFLEDVKEVKEGNYRGLIATIKFDKRNPILSDINIISKPSLRVYKGKGEISKIERRGKHKVFLSTSQGVMSGDQARKKGVGGEILFEIW